MEINKRIMALFLACTIIFTTSINVFASRPAHAEALTLTAIAFGAGGEGAGLALSSMAGPAVLIVGGAIAGYYTYQNKDYLLYKAQQTWNFLDSSTRTALQAIADGAGATVTLTKDLIDKIDTAYQQSNVGLSQETVRTTTWNGTQLVQINRVAPYMYATNIKQFSIGTKVTFGGTYAFEIKKIEDGTIGLFMDGVQVTSSNPFVLDGVEYKVGFPSWATGVINTSLNNYFFAPTIDANTGCPAITAFYVDAWSNATDGLRELGSISAPSITAPAQTYDVPKTKTKDFVFTADGTTSISSEAIKTSSLNPTVDTPATGVEAGILSGLWDIIVSAFKYLFVPDKALISNKFAGVKSTLEHKYNSDLGVIQALNATPSSFGDIRINTGSLNLWSGVNGGGTEVTIISSKAVNNHIDFIRIVTSMFWMFLLLVYVYNQIYFLIRATYPIAGPSGGGSFSAPSVDSGGGDNKMGSYSSGSFKQGRR